MCAGPFSVVIIFSRSQSKSVINNKAVYFVTLKSNRISLDYIAIIDLLIEIVCLHDTVMV